MSDSYFDTPDGRAVISQAAAFVAEEAAMAFDICMAVRQPPVESPIEARFYIWWYAVEMAETALSHHVLVSLKLQSVVDIEGDRYRLDFSVEVNDRDVLEGAAQYNLPLPRIGVELDGHDFHERTRAQVTHRNRLDRRLQRGGWTIFHFSGSELHADPESCVREVMDFAEGACVSLWGQIKSKREQG